MLPGSPRNIGIDVMLDGASVRVNPLDENSDQVSVIHFAAWTATLHDEY